jgi:NAD(P) transhydrogenase
MPDAAYELVVIGSGPAGHHAAIQAAKLRRRALLVERKSVVGGTCINVGTIPSKTMREAVMYLSGYREHSIYGQSYKVKDKITLQDLLFRVEAVVRHEIDVSRHQLTRNGIEVVNAEASFQDPHTLRLRLPDGRGESIVTAANVVLAVGTEAIADSRISLDGASILSSDDVLTLEHLPHSLVVIGGGVIGCEYASMFAALDVRVTLIDMRPRLLPFVDAEVAEALTYQLRNKRVTLRLGEKVSSVEVERNGGDPHVRVILESGKHIIADKALSCMGRAGAVSKLKPGRRGYRARPARQNQGQSSLPDRGPAHLRHRRRDRLSQPGFDLQGAGPARGVPCLWGRGALRAGVVSVRDLHHPGNLFCRAERRGTHRPGHSL